GHQRFTRSDPRHQPAQAPLALRRRAIGLFLRGKMASMRSFLLVALGLMGCGSTDSGPASGDAGAHDGDGESSSGCGFVSVLDRRWGNDGDCVLGIHQPDCCENPSASGMTLLERGRFDALEPLCQATYPGCGCPAGPTHTDSGEIALDTMSIRLACVSS